MLDEKTKRKEVASSEHHHWVRLTWRCNNKCVFCLDSELQDGSVEPVDELKKDFRQGRKNGATRLILSGGEATLHPEFIELVKYASTLGYRRIQVVSNGRMFAYRDFLDRAVDAGLQEITFSMHGHTPELHDAQTRIPGSFHQALAGITNALESRRLIVNIDIVINGHNYKQIDKIMDFFIGLGIREFDLLHVTPYGDAWKNKEKVFYDPAAAMKYLNRAFKYSRREDLFVWTNRFPPSYLTAFPELIQNPLKIKDEVRGRSEKFKEFLGGESSLPCRGTRCQYCFLNGLCDDLYREKKALDMGVVKELSVETADVANAVRFFCPDLKRLALRGGAVCELKPVLKKIPDGIKLYFFFEDYSDIGKIIGKLRGNKIYAFASDAENLELLLEEKSIRPVIELNTETAAFIKSEKKTLEKHKVAIYSRNRNDLTECREKDVKLEDFFSGGALRKVKAINLPACLPHGGSNRLPRFLDFAIFDSGGGIDLGKLSDDYIHNGYYVHPAECGGCAKKKKCPGLHVNYFRSFGFRAKPVKKGK